MPRGDAENWTVGDMMADQEALKENWVVTGEQWVKDEAEAKRVRKAIINQAKRAGKLVDYVKAPGRQGGYMVRVHENKPKGGRKK